MPLVGSGAYVRTRGSAATGSGRPPLTVPLRSYAGGMATDLDYRASTLQGTAVALLDSQGNTDAAELLEIGTLKFDNEHAPHRTQQQHFAFAFSLRPRYDAILKVDANLLSHYTPEAQAAIIDALQQITRTDKSYIVKLVLLPEEVQKNWREQRQQDRLDTVSNQAHRQPLTKPHPVKDGLHFRENSEVLVYDALMALQESRPKTDTICVAVAPAVRVGGRTFVPDFMVTLRGRAGIIEVDGGTHQKRYLADASKNDLLTDGGFCLVYRIPVEDTSNPADVKAHLDTFIARMLAR